jgi:hypothetical protein
MDIMFPPIFNSYSAVNEFIEKYYDRPVRSTACRDSPAAASACARMTSSSVRQAVLTVTDLRMYVFAMPIGKEVKVVVRRPIGDPEFRAPDGDRAVRRPSSDL